MRSSVLVLTVAIGCSTALALPVAIPNGGAEEASKQRPDRPAEVGLWTSDGVNAEFSRDTETKHDGEASFRIIHRGANHTGPSRSAVYIFNGRVVPGLSYTATAWLKTRDAVETGLGLRFKSADGSWVDAEPKYDTLSGTNDWTKVTCRWRGVEGAATFVLFLRVGVKGEAWFDEVEVRDDFEGAGRTEAFEALCEQVAAALGPIRTWRHPFGKELAADATARLEPLCARAAAYREKLAPLLETGSVPEELRARRAELTRLLSNGLQAAGRLSGLGTAIDASGRPDAPYLAGWASPAEHVFLRDCPVRWQPETTGRILAVKGETEAIQLVILAVRDELKDVTVTSGALRSDAGQMLPADQIAIHPVGFVKTTALPTRRHVPIEHEYLGWWPDPLLESFAFDVHRGDTQPVWIAISVPRDQPAGTYTGRVRVEPANSPPHEIPIEIEVANYTLPDSNPWAFKNLMSWWSVPPREFYGDRWNDGLQEKFFEFLLERRINVLSMYSNDPNVTAENVKRFAGRGQNVFLLAWYTREGRVIANDASNLRTRLKQFYPAMKEQGLLDRAYVYGWDEIGDPGAAADLYAEFTYAAKVLAKDYPGVRLLSAGTDKTYGTDSPLKGLANVSFCPHMRYDVAAARQAHANGNEVWWYETDWTIDQHLIRSRLIPWQTFKLEADGFLIWCSNRWKKNDKPIGKQILTDWNPLLDGVCPNSGAMYVYPGPDGPISSLRLENFRDGIEDYELLTAARALLPKTSDEAVRNELRRAVEIADDLTRDLRTYTTDPKVLSAHRQRLIRALVKASPR